ncbi:hypothetical protein IQ276_038760 [Desmonostoc muscorum LEGE 12446]|uniref:Uncharacterized protein n=1 Tax=Desmonostoc muscorum LEGE 12446 TaxID=1828758 RepID=A0A8J7D8C4_DESMC|nr:hypothetical protein [Desmonostoc muscorum]MCF2152229.1 hypothetical protein [Desmonostoc muscorum LEGE 12446]
MMKRFFLSHLSFLLLVVAISFIVLAGSRVQSAEPHTRSDQKKLLQPFTLATLAYQGYFKSIGIPGYSVLTSAYQSREVTAKDLVQAAVKMHLLDTSMTTDESYETLLDYQLGFMMRSLN